MWTAIDSLLVIWKFDLSGKIKRDFFQPVAVAVSIRMHHMDANETHRRKSRRERHNTAMCCFYKSWLQHPTKQPLYGHLLPNSQSIQVRQNTRKTAGDVSTNLKAMFFNGQKRMSWTCLYWSASKDLHTSADTECYLKEQPGVMDDGYE